jgi:uncharacterized protein
LAAQQACEARAAPIPAAKRIDSLDALRGLALLGVLAINLETWFRVSFFQQFALRPPDPGLDGWINRFLQVFVDLKALAIFSLLFGIGLAIQHERLAGHPRRLRLLLRRLLVLLAFGLIDLYLIWNGDILTDYAVAGLIVLPFLYGPTWALALGATGFLALHLAGPMLPPLVPSPTQAWLAQHIRMANETYGSGSFGEILAFRIKEVNAFLSLHDFIFPRTVGLFLLGVLTWRLGIVQSARRHVRALGLGAALAIVTGLAPILSDVSAAGTIVLALGYAALVIAVSSGRAGHWLAWAEPVGRMAFTNYIAQSLILGWIFYGYGLGLFGRMSSTTGLLLVLLIYGVQTLWSRWWLQRFAFGPIEWLWRALMYASRPPFRKRGRVEEGA